MNVRIKKQYSVQLSDDIVEKLDILSKNRGIGRSTLMRQFIMLGIKFREDELKELENKSEK